MINEEIIKDKTAEALYCIYKKVCERIESIHSIRRDYVLGDTLEPKKDEDKHGGPKGGIFGVTLGIQALITCEEVLGIGDTHLPYALAAWLIKQYLDPASEQHKQDNFKRIVKLSNAIIALQSLGLKDQNCEKAINGGLDALQKSACDNGGYSFWEKGAESKDMPDIVPTCHALLALKKTNSTRLECYRKGLQWLLMELTETREQGKKIVAIATLVELGVNVKAISEVKKVLNKLPNEVMTFSTDFTFTFPKGYAQFSKPVYLLKPFLLYSPEEYLSNKNVSKLYHECLENVIRNGSYRDDSGELNIKHLELVKIFANVLKFKPNPIWSDCVIKQSYQSIISVTRQLWQFVISIPGIIDEFLLNQFKHRFGRTILILIVPIAFLLYKGGIISKESWEFILTTFGILR